MLQPIESKPTKTLIFLLIFCKPPSRQNFSQYPDQFHRLGYLFNFNFRFFVSVQFFKIDIRFF